MANGDLAAQYGWTPVAPTDDIRQGYDRINALADLLVQRTGANAWSLAGITLNGSLFSTLTDPSGNSSGTLLGGIKIEGQNLKLSFRATYAGGTITSSTAGNIADTLVCTLAAAYRPATVRYGTFTVPGTAQGSFRVNADGTLQIVSLDPNSTIPSGQALQFDAVLPL